MFKARKRLMSIVNNAGGRKVDEIVKEAAIVALTELIEWSAKRGDKEFVTWGQIDHFRKLLMTETPTEETWKSLLRRVVMDGGASLRVREMIENALEQADDAQDDETGEKTQCVLCQSQHFSYRNGIRNMFRCARGSGHYGQHCSTTGEQWDVQQCLAQHPSLEDHRCTKIQGHDCPHETWDERKQYSLASWTNEERKPEKCGAVKEGYTYTCSEPKGHEDFHRARDQKGEIIDYWPRACGATYKFGGTGREYVCTAAYGHRNRNRHEAWESNPSRLLVAWRNEKDKTMKAGPIYEDRCDRCGGSGPIPIIDRHLDPIRPVCTSCGRITCGARREKCLCTKIVGHRGMHEDKVGKGTLHRRWRTVKKSDKRRRKG